MVREMISVVITKVCVDIMLLLRALLSGRPIGVSYWEFLSLCRLSGPLVLTTASVFLICTLIEGIDSSSVSG